jgi:hypothetical protein
MESSMIDVSSASKMKKRLFNELVESIKEAGQIHRGEIRALREFVFDTQDAAASEETELEFGKPGD